MIIILLCCIIYILIGIILGLWSNHRFIENYGGPDDHIISAYYGAIIWPTIVYICIYRGFRDYDGT